MSLPHLRSNTVHMLMATKGKEEVKLWLIKPWGQDGWEISTKPDSSGNPHSKRKDLTHISCSLTSTCARRQECTPTWPLHVRDGTSAPTHDLHMCTMTWTQPTWKHDIFKNKYTNFQRFLKCWCVWVFCLHYVYVTTYMLGAQRGSKRVLASLRLESESIVSCHGGTGNQTRSWKREASILNSWAIAPAPK